MDMRAEIRQCRESAGEKRGLPCASYRFPPNFAGFDGHFPGLPVLPGVCLLQAAVVTLEDWHGQAVRVLGLRRSRFQSPVQPGQRVDVECTARTGDGPAYQAVLAVAGEGGRRVCECNLRYELERGVSSS
jgi:3-hydroxymyristoyl/3-hydroxydecanoyl-(acyl carrier protein) dehydratase